MASNYACCSALERQGPGVAADQPTTDLLLELERCGLLEDTLVMWGGEIGRTPVAQVSGQTGSRDHRPHGSSTGLAGGGVRPGITLGTTDEFGYRAVENPVHVHDLHATVPHRLGVNRKQRTCRTLGCDFRPTDVAGSVVTPSFDRTFGPNAAGNA